MNTTGNMMKTRITSSLLLAISLVFTGCGATKIGDHNFTTCTSRSPVCTRDYTPVCGKSEGQRWKTYANACEACADAQVEGYKPAECP